MSVKNKLWSELLLILWTLVVFSVYFGGYFAPSIAKWTGFASLFYILMLIISTCAVALSNWRPRAAASPDCPDSRVPDLKDEAETGGSIEIVPEVQDEVSLNEIRTVS